VDIFNLDIFNILTVVYILYMIMCMTSDGFFDDVVGNVFIYSIVYLIMLFLLAVFVFIAFVIYGEITQMRFGFPGG